MKNYEFIEHTADIGVRIYGRNLVALFKNSAQALIGLITDFKPSPNSEKTVILEGKTLEDLLVSWLNEIISLFFAEKFLLKNSDIIISKGNPNRLEAKLKGSSYDPYSQKVNTEIKAATYHNLKIEKVPRGFKAEIIFDV